ncbi:MAG: serine/threonine protein kinase, partial [Labilithrix sp.]|nr:serine/threonine protein kinase [Labilithrix sp.]
MTKADTTVERVGGYRVVRRLATGGTSDVLLAKAEGPLGFERTVVLKLLLSQFRDDEDFARMFAREASAYARLSHPSIVRLFDFFAVPASEPGAPPRQGGRDGQLCMVLEHIDGPPLTRLRTMLKAAGRELDDRSAIYVATRIFDALAAAHAAVDEGGALAPVIHRDVNPSNVLMPWDGQVKLADFGVAKVAGLSHQSVAGMIKGTYGYMAPEQVTGEAVTPRADVYAAGIILWELLTKRRAFQRGALPEIEALRAMAEPRLISLDTIRPDVDRAVRDAVRRALEPRAEQRTVTAEEMVAILSAVVPADEGRERLVSALAVVRPASDPAMPAPAPSHPPSTSPDGPRTVPA